MKSKGFNNNLLLSGTAAPITSAQDQLPNISTRPLLAGNSNPVNRDNGNNQ